YQAVEELEGVVAHRCERQIYGVTRSIVVTRSQSFLAKQLVGLAQTRGRVEVHLAELDRLLAGGRHKMDRAKLEPRVAEALAPRRMKDHDHAGFRPIYRWTDQKIQVHALYSVASLMLVNLAWREADRAGMGLSPNEVMEALAAIHEVTLMYPPAKGQGRPRILRKLTRMDQTQQGLFELFGLDAFAPREVTTAKWRGF